MPKTQNLKKMYKNRSAKALFLTRAGSVLLVRKSEDSSGNAGKYEFPGGKVGECEKPISALLREVREEIGGGIINLIDVIEEIPKQRYFLASDGRRFFQQFFFLIVLSRGDGGILQKVRLSEEHTECILVPYEDIFSMMEDGDVSDAVAFALKYFEK